MSAAPSRHRAPAIARAIWPTVVVTAFALTPVLEAKAIRLALPSELQQEVEDLRVTQRRSFTLPARPVDHFLVFGDNEVMQYRAGWSERTQLAVGQGALAVFREKTWRKFSFELADPRSGRLPVDCIESSESRGLKVAGRHSETDLDLPWDQELRCRFTSPAGAPRDLLVSFGRGTLSDERGPIVAVEASRRVEGTPIALPTPVGFLFQRDGKAVGAVEVLNKGRFVLANTLSAEERLDLLAISTALLLADSIE